MIPITGIQDDVAVNIQLFRDGIQGILPNRSFCDDGKIDHCPPEPIIDPRSTAGIVIQSIYVCVIILLSSTGNLIVLTAIYKHKYLQNKTSIFVANLAIADFANGFIAVPFILVCTITYKWPFTEAMCSFLAFLIILFCTVSMGTLGAIAYDRYNAIVHPLKYHNRMSKSRICFFICWIWTQSLVISLCPLFGWSEYIYFRNEYLCTANWGYEISYTITLTVVCFGWPFIIMVYSYGRIFIVARRHSRQIAALQAVLPQQSGTTSHSNHPRHSNYRGSYKRQFKKDAKSATMILAVIGAFVACWVPHGVTMYSFIIEDLNGIPDFIYTTTTLLAMSNSMLNPILYSLLNRPYRTAFKKILCSCFVAIHKRQSTDGQSNTRQRPRRITDDTDDTIQSGEPPFPSNDQTSRRNIFLVTAHSAIYEEDASVSVAPVEVSSTGAPNAPGICLTEMVTHTIKITHTISALVNTTEAGPANESNPYNDLI